MSLHINTQTRKELSVGILWFLLACIHLYTVEVSTIIRARRGLHTFSTQSSNIQQTCAYRGDS